MLHARHITFVLLPVLLLSTGCGAKGGLLGAATAKTAGAAAAKSVTPDDPSLLAADTRRASFWAQKYGGSASLVMSIQTTALNGQAISAAGNVYFCGEAFYASKPCVFVARHYLTGWIGQDTEIADYNRVASQLRPIGSYAIKAAAAWSLAHGWTMPLAAAQPCATGACPTGQAITNPATGKAFFISSRAFLTQPANADPAWSLYASNKKYVIDAVTGAVTPPTAQVNPDDLLNQGSEPDQQRASSVWLPTNPGQPTIQTDPSAN